MWNCAYQIYPRTIKVVSILSKFIFLDLKTCFFEKRVSKEISYIVYISAILPNIVYISLVSLKKISLRPACDVSPVAMFVDCGGELQRSTSQPRSCKMQKSSQLKFQVVTGNLNRQCSEICAQLLSITAP